MKFVMKLVADVGNENLTYLEDNCHVGKWYTR